MDTKDILIELTTALGIYDAERKFQKCYKKYEVEPRSIILHECGAIGIVYGSNGSRLMVRYLNREHDGYELNTPFKVIGYREMVKRLEIPNYTITN
jgi:hypothetical protein